MIAAKRDTLPNRLRLGALVAYELACIRTPGGSTVYHRLISRKFW